MNISKLIDLTHFLDETIPTWNGSCGFKLDIKMDYPEGGLRVHSLKCHAGIGTHMDAPSHFVEDSWNIGQIPLENFIVPAFVLHIEGGPDLMIEAKDIESFEKKHGKIAPNSLFFGSTGWDRYWSDVDQYRNVDESGKMHFPGFSADAAALLLERNIVGLGIDTLSPDGSNHGPTSLNFPVHKLILGAKKYILENVANLSLMPATGAYVIALPARAKWASESTTRVVGIIPK